MTIHPVVRRHWPKAVAGLLAVVFAVVLAVVLVRELPPTIRYIKMERMLPAPYDLPATQTGSPRFERAGRG